MAYEEVNYKVGHDEYFFGNSKGGWLSILYIRGPVETEEEKLRNGRLIEISPGCMPLFKKILFTDKEIAVAECKRRNHTPPEFKTVELKDMIYNIRKESDGSMMIYWINDLVPPYSRSREVIGNIMPLHIQHAFIEKGAADKLREFVKKHYDEESDKT